MTRADVVSGTRNVAGAGVRGRRQCQEVGGRVAGLACQPSMRQHGEPMECLPVVSACSLWLRVGLSGSGVEEFRGLCRIHEV